MRRLSAYSLPLAKSPAHQFAQRFRQPVSDFYVSPQGAPGAPHPLTAGHFFMD
jgi:hypothetical protein